MNKLERKNMIRLYKENFITPGILLIKNKINHKILLSASLNVHKLPNRLLAELKLGRHMNKLLQKEWDELGEDNFIFEVVEEIKQQDNINYDYEYALKVAMKQWMEKLSPYGEKGYH